MAYYLTLSLTLTITLNLLTLTLLTLILDTENLGPPFTGLPTWANMLGLIANGGSYVALSHVGPYTVVSP